jgi:UDP-4-amino-4,6-dideoxy-N-acetyl-beta-L-altrosamine transaminase
MTEHSSDVRLLPYGSQWIDDEDIAAVIEVLRGEWLTTGPAVAAFEAALAAAGHAQHAIAVSSGTAALHTIYAAAKLGRGDEIVTSPLTFVATASTALLLGADVRFADVEPDTGNLDARAAAAASNARTRLWVAVDYAGHPARYAALQPAAHAQGARLVADAAHSFGARYNGEPVGRLADATTTSFHPVKPFTTAEGGAVLTDDDTWARGARAFRNHGIVRERDEMNAPGAAWHYEVQSLGLNYRLPDLLCALGSSQLAKLERFVARRRALAARYQEALGAQAALELPARHEDCDPSWHLYVIRVREAARRDAFFDFLRARGIGVQVHYLPVYLHPVYADLGYRAGLCPVAEDFAARAVSIPLYPKMRDQDADRVIDTIDAACRAVL